MSSSDADYSNTIIYKIYCKDETIRDVYVGHTINLIQRKTAHRLSCTNRKLPNSGCKLYEVIRNNGGWDNWNMSIVGFYNCKNLYEARQREQEHFIALKATLNSVEPFPSRNVRSSLVEAPATAMVPAPSHISTVPTPNLNPNPEVVDSTVNRTIRPRPLVNNSRVRYKCEPCGFTTDNKTDYERHLTRRKHITPTEKKNETNF
jgi:hypothetical protein